MMAMVRVTLASGVELYFGPFPAIEAAEKADEANRGGVPAAVLPYHD